jgi:hypothetical protein
VVSLCHRERRQRIAFDVAVVFAVVQVNGINGIRRAFPRDSGASRVVLQRDEPLKPLFDGRPGIGLACRCL